MDDGQKTPREHPDFNSYVKFLRVFIKNRQMDRQTDRHLYLIPTWFAFAFYTGIVSSGVRRTNTPAAHELEELFFCCLRKVSPAHQCLVGVWYIVKEFGW
jgi:hypothetical protein